MVTYIQNIWDFVFNFVFVTHVLVNQTLLELLNFTFAVGDNLLWKWCFYDKSLMAWWFGYQGNLNLE